MKTPSRIHFMGIGGSGASAVAAIAKARGFQVTGCDSSPNNSFTKVFDRDSIFPGHSPKHLKNVDLLAITPAILSLDKNNPEIIAAKNKSLPILTWQEFMGKFLEKDKFVIAVCGTHGKSTTTAMISQLLGDAGLDPTVELGAIVPRWQTNFKIGKGKYFVTEADEFNDNFLVSVPDIAIVTSIEMDHPEYFKNFDDYKKSFVKFLGKVKDQIVANLDDPEVKEVLDSVKKISPVQILDYSKLKTNLKLAIPGQFNQLNALAAYTIGQLLGIDQDLMKHSLESYSGIERRFEYLGKYQEAKVYSDFGHHPTEIAVTMEAAKEYFKNQNILLVFQPHMFSRTKALFKEFVQTFQELLSSQISIIITDIYPSREKDTGLVNSQMLVEAVNNNQLVYCTKTQLKQVIDNKIQKSDIIFFMGAGDIDKFASKLVSS